MPRGNSVACSLYAACVVGREAAIGSMLSVAGVASRGSVRKCRWPGLASSDGCSALLPSCTPPSLQLILFMHGQLLPAWVLVVLRWGRQI